MVNIVKKMPNIIKKIIAVVVTLTVSIWLIGPSVAQAVTAEELQAQIDTLLAQLATLQAQLATLQQGETSIIVGCTITSFSRNLQGGMSGDDVRCLQIILNSDLDTKLASSGVGSPGKETSYFGSLTKAAVIKFQEKYAGKVLGPWSLTIGTGFVKTTTKTKLNEFLAKTSPLGVADIITEYFKISQKEITTPLLVGPASRYGCESANDCAYITDKGEYDLPENDCGNLDYFGLSSDSAGITTDDSIACECEQHIATQEPCSINIEAGEQECIWIEDNFDYTVCKKIEEEPPIISPDIKLSNFYYSPENPVVNEQVNFFVTVENIGTASCTEVSLDLNFGNDLGILLRYIWPCHYYPFDPDQPCFDPGDKFTGPGELVEFSYNSSGSYNASIYGFCGNFLVGTTEGDLDWSNNGPLSVTVNVVE